MIIISNKTAVDSEIVSRRWEKFFLESNFILNALNAGIGDEWLRSTRCSPLASPGGVN